MQSCLRLRGTLDLPVLAQLVELAIATDLSLVHVNHRHEALRLAVYAVRDLHLVLTVDFVEHNLAEFDTLFFEKLFGFVAVAAVGSRDDCCLLFRENLLKAF